MGILFFQLILEKQKLIAMQLHLSEDKYSDSVCLHAKTVKTRISLKYCFIFLLEKK